MSRPSFPALGFDPTPGDPDEVTRLVQALHVRADDLTVAAGRAANLAPEGLRAQVVEAFLAHLHGPTTEVLRNCAATSRAGADTLRTWAIKLRLLQDEASDLETRARNAAAAQSAARAAANAVGLLQSTTAPATHLQDLAAARDDLARATADLTRIRSEAVDLRSEYRSAANGVAGLLTPLPLPVLHLELVPGVPWDALLNPDNLEGRLPGGVDTRLPTDPEALLAALNAARAMGLPPQAYDKLLQQYYVAVAAQKAGIDLRAWDPSKGAFANEATVEAIYDYYSKLYLENPEKFSWAGMASLIGGSFGAGFFDLDTVQKIAAAITAAWPPGVPKPPEVKSLEAVAGMSAEEFAYYQTTLLTMQKKIFFDASMMHEAYLSGGDPNGNLAAVQELYDADLIDDGAWVAWQDIHTGDPSLVALGNKALLSREQNETIVDQYNEMQAHPVTGQGFTYLMTAVGQPSIPGAQSPGQFSPFVIDVPAPGGIPFLAQPQIEVGTPFPDFNIADQDDRWKMVEGSTLPAFEDFRTQHPEELVAELETPAGERMDEQRLTDGGLDGRIDELIGEYLTGWTATPGVVVAGKEYSLP